MLHPRNISKRWRRLLSLDTFSGQVALAVLANACIAAFGMATGLIAARLLGPQGRGELAAIQSWPLLVASLAQVGMPEALTYFAARSPHRSGQFLASAQTIVSGSGCLFAGVGWWLMPVLLSAQPPEVVAAARVFLLMIAVYAIIGLPSQLLRSARAWRAWNAARISPNATWLMVLTFCVLVPDFRAQASPIFLSRLYLAQYALLALPTIVLVTHYIRGPFRASKVLFRPMLKFGLPAMLNVIPQTMNQRLDQLAMTAFLPPQSLGLYVVAVAWSGAASPIISAVGPILFPRLSAMHNVQEQSTVLVRVVRSSAAIIVIMTIILLATTPSLLPLVFGTAFAGAVPAALVLVIGTGCNTLNMTIEDGLRGLGRPGSVLRAEAIGFGGTAICLVFFLPVLGIMGAAIASTLGYMAGSTYLMWLLRENYWQECESS